jgi:hypothetical protein
VIAGEVLAVGGYALGLVAIGLGLDLLARTTHRRSDAYRTAGFTYRPELDHWVCPRGEQLWPHEYDPDRRLVRYRARAQVCNRCPVKDRCTDSNEGREIAHALDPWPRSEAGRFHRGIALVPIALAAVIVVGEAIRRPSPADLGVLAGIALLTALAGFRLLADFRATPANFPGQSPSEGLHQHHGSRGPITSRRSDV